MAKHPIGTGVLAPKPTLKLKLAAPTLAAGTGATLADAPDNPSSPTTPKPPRRTPKPKAAPKLPKKAPTPLKNPFQKPQPDPLSQYPDVQAPMPTTVFPKKPSAMTKALNSAAANNGLVTDPTDLLPTSDRPKKTAGSGGGIPIAAATGGSLLSGAVHALESGGKTALSVGGTTLKNLGQQALELPQNVGVGLYNIATHPARDLKSLESLPTSLADSYAAAHGGIIGGHATSGGIIQSLEKTDPILQTLQGHPKALEERPLQSLLDVSGAGKVLDAGAGNLARTGALGQTLKEAADRTPLRNVIVPAVDSDGNLRATVVANSPDAATATQAAHISPGLIQGAVQKSIMNSPKLYKGLTNTAEVVGHPVRSIYNIASKQGLHTAQEQQMLHLADIHMSSASNERRASLDHAAQQLVKARPKNDTAANLVPHYLFGTPTDTDAARQMLTQRLTNYTKALSDHNDAQVAKHLLNQGDLGDLDQYRELMNKPAQTELNKAMVGDPFDKTKIQSSLSQHEMSPQQLEENQRNRENLNASMSDDVLGQAHKAGDQLKNLQHTISQQMIDRQLIPQGAADRTPLLQAAHANGLPVQRVTIPTEASLTAKQAQKDLVQAQREYRDARITKADHGVLDAKRDQLVDARANFNNLKAHLNAKYTGHAIADDTVPKEMKGFRPVSNDELQQRLDDLGVPRSEYFNTGTAEDQGVSNYLKGRRSRGDTASPALTGANLQRGAFSAGYSGAARSILHGISRIESAKEWDSFIRQFGHKPSWGAPYYTKFDVRQDHEALERATGMKWSAVKARAQGLTPEQASKISDNFQNTPQEFFEADRQAAANQAVDPNHMEGVAPEENLSLVPSKVLQRREQHYATRKPTFMSHLNNYFRTAVLPLSPKYYGSVTGEGAFRGAVNGMHPGNYVQDYRAGKQLPQALRDAGYHDEADHYEAVTGLGTHMAMQTRDIQDEINQMHQAGSEPTGKLRAAATKAARTYRQVATAPMKGAAWLERAQTKVVVGHAVRQDIKLMTGHMSSAMLSASNYMDRIAHGYAADPSKAAEISNQIDHVLGQYNHFSPQEQAFIRNVAPFWPWYKNALQFVYVTLPKDHPLLTAVLNEAGTANASAWTQSHRGLPSTNEFGVNYGDLLSDASTAPGAYKDWMRFLPMGIAATPPAQIPFSVAFPTLQSGVLALEGQSPFYTPLKGSGTYGDVTPFSTQAIGDALKATGESVVPYNAANRIRKGAVSGGWKGALAAAVNPVPTTHYSGTTTGGGINSIPAIPSKLPSLPKNLPSIPSSVG